jgi:hypothetical protein
VVVGLPDSRQLRSDFNDRRALVRVVSVVSPTCDDCLAGLTLLLEAIDGAASVVSLVLWLAMLPGDGPKVAEKAAKRFAIETPSLHYWEEEGWPVSTSLRHVLGIGRYDPVRSAWDVYLLYAPGVEWGNGDPPVPTAWGYNTRDELPAGERLSAALVRDWMRD